jgi:uncharacterized protein YbjT (DUF2867 family)
MHVILFGATGMVGEGVLIECLADPGVEKVLVIGRRSCGRTHAKMREVLRSDFFDWSDAGDLFAGYDACFFCLGVSSADMSAQEYYRLTYELTIACANAIAARSPRCTFCYVSGENTDGTERKGMMWAKVKGKTENALLALFPSAYMFRPGYIHPMKGVRSPRRLYRAFHAVAVPLWPVLRRVMAAHSTTTQNIGLAMLRVARSGYAKRHLENPDIDGVASAALGPG